MKKLLVSIFTISYLTNVYPENLTNHFMTYSYAKEGEQTSPTFIRLSETKWERAPKPYINHLDHLIMLSAPIEVIFDINTMGNPENLRITKSSCHNNIDREILRSFRSAKINKEVIAHLDKFKNFVQPIHIHMNKNLSYTDQSGFLNFNSEVWLDQQNERTKEFHYATRPQLNVKPEILEGLTRDIDFEIKLDKNNKISKVTITKSSGLISLDQAIQSALIDTPIIINPSLKNLLRKSFKDRISFQYSQCIQERLEETYKN